MQSDRSDNFEKQTVQRLLNDASSTHSKVVTNSVGMGLLNLRKRYLTESPTAKYIEQLYSTCLLEIQSFDPDFINEISFTALDARIHESVNVWDTINLYLPTENSHPQQEFNNIQHTFPLQEVFVLVWKAMIDHQLYQHHYSGTDEERLAAATSDLPKRLLSLKICIEQLSLKPLCHQGCRHELVFLLNKSHSDIDLIEDARSVILEHTRFKVNDFFLQTYNSISSITRKTWLSAILKEWASKPSFITVMKVLQVNDLIDSIHHSLQKLCIYHGSDPQEIKLDSMIDEAISIIEFTPELLQQPVIAKACFILQERAVHDQLIRNIALSSMQNWIQTEFDWDAEEDKNKLNNFHSVLQIFQKLSHYYDRIKTLIVQEGESFESIASFCNLYFAAICKSTQLPDALGVIENDFQRLDNALIKLKNDNFADEIENFFAIWFLKKGLHFARNSSCRRLYQLLLDPIFQSKVICNDAILLQYMRNNHISATDQISLEITLYMVNRLFLHAIIVRPEDWTETFKHLYQLALIFVEKTFNSTSVITTTLKKDSYPKALIKQLNYLNNQAKENPLQMRRPQQMIVLPHCIHTSHEWYLISSLLSHENLEQVYQSQAIKINKILKDSLIKYTPALRYDTWWFSYCLRTIRLLTPQSRIFFLNLYMPFIKEFFIHLSTLQNKSTSNATNFMHLLSLFPTSDRISVLQQFGKEFILNSFNVKVLKDLYKQRKDEGTWDTLTTWLFPNKDDLYINIKNADDLYVCLLLLDDDKKAEFLITLDSRLTDIILDKNSIFRFNELLPDSAFKIIGMLLFGPSFEKLFEINVGLKTILQSIPTTRQTSVTDFLVECSTIEPCFIDFFNVLPQYKWADIVLSEGILNELAVFRLAKSLKKISPLKWNDFFKQSDNEIFKEIYNSGAGLEVIFKKIDTDLWSNFIEAYGKDKICKLIIKNCLFASEPEELAKIKAILPVEFCQTLPILLPSTLSQSQNYRRLKNDLALFSLLIAGAAMIALGMFLTLSALTCGLLIAAGSLIFIPSAGYLVQRARSQKSAYAASPSTVSSPDSTVTIMTNTAMQTQKSKPSASIQTQSVSASTIPTIRHAYIRFLSRMKPRNELDELNNEASHVFRPSPYK